MATEKTTAPDSTATSAATPTRKPRKAAAKKVARAPRKAPAPAASPIAATEPTVTEPTVTDEAVDREVSVATDDALDREVSVATDAAFAPPASTATPVLRNISEIRHALRTNITPVFFVGATPFNLLGLDRWVRNFHYITYYDGWDGAHPRMFTPKRKPYVEFESGEDINNWLLDNDEVRAFIASKTPEGQTPRIAMVFLDEETERICREARWELILPSAELRTHLDSKLVTTRLANEVDVPSVPNTMATVAGWDDVVKVAEDAGLGTDLVIQSAYGDSGKTTFFIDSQESFAKHADDIVDQEVKIMRRIDNRPVAVEAVLTSSGTIVGPFMSELTGHAELTPYRGGWCGNEMFPTVLSEAARSKATALVQRLGDRLGQEGYKGFFEVDVLVDITDDEVYLGELNPRISGASAITNVTAGAYADVPLFLFHLLEYLDVEVDIDVAEINERWQRLAGDDEWSQMIVKETDDVVEHIDRAAATGQYTLGADGALTFRRAALDWHQLQNEGEAFFLRIYGTGDYRWKGADLGVIVTKGRLQKVVDGTYVLTERAKSLIHALRADYAGTPVDGSTGVISAAK
ncbi:MAG: biotin carboxylase [Phycicoccus sp.]|nr:biotin carboxylase [Phycicoccus sp.]